MIVLDGYACPALAKDTPSTVLSETRGLGTGTGSASNLEVQIPFRNAFLRPWILPVLSTNQPHDFPFQKMSQFSVFQNTV